MSFIICRRSSPSATTTEETGEHVSPLASFLASSTPFPARAALAGFNL